MANLINTVAPCTSIRLTSRLEKLFFCRRKAHSCHPLLFHSNKVNYRIQLTAPANLAIYHKGLCRRSEVGWDLLRMDGRRQLTAFQNAINPILEQHLVFRQTILIYSYNPIFSRILKSGKRTFNWESRVLKRRIFKSALTNQLKLGKPNFGVSQGND